MTALPKFMLPLQPLAPRRMKKPARAARLLGAVLGGAPPRSGRLNNFVMQRQVQTEWCWAAVSASVASYYRPSQSWTQCRIATHVLRNNNMNVNCCAGPAPCNRPGSLDEPLMVVGHYGGRRNNRIPIADVMNEIARGRPFGVRIEWQGQGGHFVVIGGWSISPQNVTYVDVFDPWYAFVQLPVSDFAQRYRGIGQWSHSYFTVPGTAPGSGRAIRKGPPMSA